jgi:hypothetical protein
MNKNIGFSKNKRNTPLASSAFIFFNQSYSASGRGTLTDHNPAVPVANRLGRNHHGGVFLNATRAQIKRKNLYNLSDTPLILAHYRLNNKFATSLSMLPPEHALTSLPMAPEFVAVSGANLKEAA